MHDELTPVARNPMGFRRCKGVDAIGKLLRRGESLALDAQDSVFEAPAFEVRFELLSAASCAPSMSTKRALVDFGDRSVEMAGSRNPGAFRALGITPAADFAEAWRLATRIVGSDPVTVVAPNFWSRKALKFDVQQ